MVDEELRARIISRAKMKLGKMKELSVLEAVTLLEHIEELESRPTPLAPDGADVCHIVTHFFIDGTCAMCGVPEPRPAGKA